MKEGESKAIWKRLFLRLCTVISVTVIDVFDGGRRFIAHSPTVIPTMATTHRDALMYWSYSLELYIWQYRISRFFHTLNTILSKFLLQNSMQALYDTIPPRSKSQQARKRKAEASLMEEGLLKCPALERGESSGNDTTTDQ
ncbi:unnamed protein product, partial [Brassica rapa subsp. narinosa]